MELNINKEKMYDLLSKDAKNKLALMVEQTFLETKSLEEIVKFYLNEAINAENKDAIVNVSLLMIRDIIEGEDEYVMHAHQLLKDGNTDPFRVSAHKVFGVFYPNGSFDINIKGSLSKGYSYTSISTGKSSNEIDSPYVIKFSDLCNKKNKTFSHEALNEIKGIVSFILNNYPEFYNKIFKNMEQKTK